MSDTSILSYSVDLNDQEMPDPLPPGTYSGEIVKTERKTSGAGNNYLAVSVRIPPEGFPADFNADGLDDGIILTYNRLSTEDNAMARYRMRRFLESVGMVPSKEIDINDLLGRTLSVEVGNQVYEGEKRAQITKLLGST